MGKLLNIDSSVMRVMARIADLIILNTLFILTSLGMITIGASVCALQTSLQNLLHGKSNKVVQNYFRIFKQNFRQATVLWLMVLSVGLILVSDLMFLSKLPIPLEFLMGGAAVVVAVITGIIAVYGFAMIGRYRNSLKRQVQNVIVVSLHHWFQTLFLLVFNAFVIYFTFSSPEALLTMIYLLTFGGFALINLGSAVMMKQVFDKIEKKTN